MNATRYLPFVGRLFIGLPFVVSGLSKLATYGATIGSRPLASRCPLRWRTP
jgi:putative oxidoreductase